jgi:SnoaL-like protein
MDLPAPVAAWHEIAASRDPAGLADLLADDVVFRSPAVHGDQAGKELTTAYLSAAVVVLGPTLAYQRQWYAERNAVLEFEAELDGLTVHGIDMLEWDAEGKLVEFTVMVRPIRGLEKLIEKMAAELFG